MSSLAPYAQIGTGRIDQPFRIVPGMLLEGHNGAKGGPSDVTGSDLTPSELIVLGLTKLQDYSSSFPQRAPFTFDEKFKIHTSKHPARSATKILRGKVLRGPEHEEPAEARGSPQRSCLGPVSATLLEVVVEPLEKLDGHRDLPDSRAVPAVKTL